MQSALETTLTNLPNYAALLLMLVWQRQTINALLENQTKLIDRLMALMKLGKPDATESDQ